MRRHVLDGRNQPSRKKDAGADVNAVTAPELAHAPAAVVAPLAGLGSAHWGLYPHELRQAAALAGAGDQLALAIHWATSQPGHFNLFG